MRGLLLMSISKDEIVVETEDAYEQSDILINYALFVCVLQSFIAIIDLQIISIRRNSAYYVVLVNIPSNKFLRLCSSLYNRGDN